MECLQPITFVFKIETGSSRTRCKEFNYFIAAFGGRYVEMALAFIGLQIRTGSLWP
jgi:hypothetical protein